MAADQGGELSLTRLTHRFEGQFPFGWRAGRLILGELVGRHGVPRGFEAGSLPLDFEDISQGSDHDGSAVDLHSRGLAAQSVE